MVKVGDSVQLLSYASSARAIVLEIETQEHTGVTVATVQWDTLGKRLGLGSKYNLRQLGTAADLPTPEPKRLPVRDYRDALDVQFASNMSGVALSLMSLITRCRELGVDVRRDPAVTLFVAKLADMVGMSFEWPSAAETECNRQVACHIRMADGTYVPVHIEITDSPEVPGMPGANVPSPAGTKGTDAEGQ